MRIAVTHGDQPHGGASCSISPEMLLCLLLYMKQIDESILGQGYIYTTVVSNRECVKANYLGYVENDRRQKISGEHRSELESHPPK